MDDTRSTNEETESVSRDEGPAAATPAPEAIAVRAYELYLSRGRIDGFDLDDWLQAERELRVVPTD